jgi:hypothetical protein
MDLDVVVTIAGRTTGGVVTVAPNRSGGGYIPGGRQEEWLSTGLVKDLVGIAQTNGLDMDEVIKSVSKKVLEAATEALGPPKRVE